MFSDWAKAVAIARKQKSKQEKTVNRILGGNYDRQRKASNRSKGPKKRQEGIPIDGYGGGDPGTSPGSANPTENLS